MPVESSDDPWVVPDPVAPAKRPVPPATTQVMSKTDVRPSGAMTRLNVPLCTRCSSSPLAAVRVIVPGPNVPVPGREVHERAVRHGDRGAAEMQEHARSGARVAPQRRPPGQVVGGVNVSTTRSWPRERPRRVRRRDRRGERQAESRDQHGCPEHPLHPWTSFRSGAKRLPRRSTNGLCVIGGRRLECPQAPARRDRHGVRHPGPAPRELRGRRPRPGSSRAAHPAGGAAHLTGDARLR